MKNTNVKSEKNFSQINNSNIEANQKIPIVSKIFNPFHGGTAFGAIYAMDDLDAYETSVLIFIGSKLVVNGDHHSWLKISKREIIRATKIGRSKVTQVIQTLHDKSYIYIESNFDEFNSQQENTYYLSDYLFEKYCEIIEQKKSSGQCVTTPAVLRTPPGHGTACYNTSVAISSEDDFEFAERSEKKEIKIDKIELTGGGSPEAESNGLSLHQNSIEVIGANNLATPNMAPPPDELESIGFESVGEQFNNRIKKARNELKSDYKIVTDYHRKMLAIFRPTDPQLLKKCWVRDNDILFFTDQVFEKYGQECCAIIDKLFTYALDNGKCGKLAWDVNTAWSLINAAKEIKNE